MTRVGTLGELDVQVGDVVEYRGKRYTIGISPRTLRLYAFAIHGIGLQLVEASQDPTWELISRAETLKPEDFL
jgi:hypothetical protein